MLYSYSAHWKTTAYQISAKSDDIWKLAKKVPKKLWNIFNENYTMVNLIEGGTTLLFSTFDKTQ